MEGKNMMMAVPRKVSMGEEGLLHVGPFFVFGLYLKSHPCMRPVGYG